MKIILRANFGGPGGIQTRDLRGADFAQNRANVLPLVKGVGIFLESPSQFSEQANGFPRPDATKRPDLRLTGGLFFAFNSPGVADLSHCSKKRLLSSNSASFSFKNP
jgi:hypothetical protein